MSDLSDADESPTSPGNDSPGSAPRPPGKKRANHNELERKRRQHQKDQLQNLKNAIPLLRQEKPSTVLILAKAKEYIDQLSKMVLENDAQLNSLRARLGDPPKPPDAVMALCTSAAAVPLTIKHESLDLLKHENHELKRQMEQLESRLSQSTPPLRGTKRPASPHVLASPSLPPQLSAPQGYYAMPDFNGANAMASLAAVATAEVVTRENAFRGISMHESMYNDNPYHFRKRKSYADNDFEAAKQDYYSSRRNSSYDILKQYQQRSTESDAGLLQNFAVQARRASIPSLFLDGMPPPMEPAPAAMPDDTHASS